MDVVDTILLDKGSTVHDAQLSSSVAAAVATMVRAHVGALIVCDGSRPVGIFTERDVMVRVLLAGRDPARTMLDMVMTRDPLCITPTTTVKEAMAIMTDRRCRHLPVVRGGRIAGMISIGDLVRWESRHQEVELHQLTEYICGKYPG
jgi:CBS domain-containing protein